MQSQPKNDIEGLQEAGEYQGQNELVKVEQAS